MKPADDERLRHMLDAAREAVDLLGGIGSEELEQDRKLALALVKLIEITGEAAANVSEERRRSIPEIPWSVAVAMRNRLIHGYYDVDAQVVAQTIRIDFPGLVHALQRALGEDR